ncbi:hypothetical protein ABIA70_002093 [Arthrobacter sp. 754]
MVAPASADSGINAATPPGLSAFQIGNRPDDFATFAYQAQELENINALLKTPRSAKSLTQRAPQLQTISDGLA